MALLALGIWRAWPWKLQEQIAPTAVESQLVDGVRFMADPPKVPAPSLVGDNSVSIGDERLPLKYFTDQALALIDKIKDKAELTEDDIVALALTAAQAVMARHMEPAGKHTDEETLTTLFSILDDYRVVEATFEKIRQIVSHHFDALRPEMKPQDEDLRGTALKFEPREHDEMQMPEAIKVTDKEGRWAMYEIVRDGTTPVLSHGFEVGPLHTGQRKICGRDDR